MLTNYRANRQKRASPNQHTCKWRLFPYLFSFDLSYVAKAGLELTKWLCMTQNFWPSCPSPPPKCWDYRCTLLNPVYSVLGMQPRASHVPVRLCANQSSSQALALSLLSYDLSIMWFLESWEVKCGWIWLKTMHLFGIQTYLTIFNLDTLEDCPSPYACTPRSIAQFMFFINI